MRSILKSHKRSDSSVSDSNVPLEPPYHKTATFKANGSPTGVSSTKLTPPMHASGFHQSSMSSPKKLLTPIKKMFGHHSKPTVVPSTSESLQSITNGDLEPPPGHKMFRKGRHSVPDLTELRSSSYSSQGNTLLASSSSQSLNDPSWNDSKVAMAIPGLPPLPDLDFYTHANSSLDSRNDTRNVRDIPIIQRNVSDSSISKSKSSLLSLAVQDANLLKNEASDGADDDEDESKDSDSSSQFSFVRDIRGGRNTSVKYYKTKVPSAVDDAENAQNYFNMDDMGFEAEALSDYDFENNGYGDDADFDDEITSNMGRYEEFLPDKNNTEQGQISITSFKSSSSQVSAGRSEIIVQSDSPVDRLDPPHTPALKSPDYAGGFLDTYLDSKSPNYLSGPSPNPLWVPQSGSDKPIEDKSVSKPHTGLGIVLPEENTQSIPGSHSVTDMMKMLQHLQSSPISEKEEPISSPMEVPPKFIFSQDIRNIDEKSEILSTSDPSKRKSVADMMAALSLLGQIDSSVPINAPANEPKVLKAEGHDAPKSKRYSWLSEDDSCPDADIEGNPSTRTLEKDILDEINSIPENYDFSENDSAMSPGTQNHSFLRSHSYSKRPQKIVIDRSFSERKIELPNKTVTFYRSKSLDQGSVDKTRNLARAASLRSVISFNDEDMSEGAEDTQPEIEDESFGKTGYSQTSYRSSNLAPQKSASLEPITESATPRIE